MAIAGAFKFFFFALAVCTIAHAAILYRDELSRAGLVTGSLSPTDFLLYRVVAAKGAVSNNYVTQNVPYNGYRVNITYITALENGITQNATASIVSGGLGRSNVTIALRSALSRGFNYTISIYGKNL